MVLFRKWLTIALNLCEKLLTETDRHYSHLIVVLVVAEVEKRIEGRRLYLDILESTERKKNSNRKGILYTMNVCDANMCFLCLSYVAPKHVT